MNSKNIFTEYLKGPQLFTFYSKNPKKGILSLFRKKYSPSRVKFNQQRFIPNDSSKYWKFLK